MTNSSTRLRVFADYFQFTLEDESIRQWDVPAYWGTQLATGKIAAVPGVGGILGVGTVRNMDVPVEITVGETPPDDDFSTWDHVTEGSVAVPSGLLVVLGATQPWAEAPRIAVEPKTYRVRIFYGGLDTLSEDALDGDDYYRIVLWPGEAREPAVLKPYQGAYFPGG